MRHRRKYILIGVLPLILLAIPFVYEVIERELQFSASHRELLAEIALTDQKDPNWRWEELNQSRAAVPDAENIVPRIDEIKAILGNRVGVRVGAANFDSILDEEIAVNQLYSPEEVYLLEEHQRFHGKSLALARKLHHFNKGRYLLPLGEDPVSTPLPYTEPIREVVSLLRFEAIDMSLKQRPKDAILALHGMLNCDQTLQDDLFLIGHLVRHACRSIFTNQLEKTLALCEPGMELERLIEPLRFATESNESIWGIRGERFITHRIFERFEEDPSRLREMAAIVAMSGVKSKNFDLSKYRPFLKKDHAIALRKYRELLDTFQLPMHEQWKVLPNFLIPHKENEIVLTDSLFPSLVKTLQSEWRTMAQLRAARVAVAVELFRNEQKRWPISLEEIPQKWLSSVPSDPYDGKPIRFLKFNDGVIIYSVGADLIDDGGRLNFRAGIGSETGDVGLRLWNPEQRRLPPPPPRPEELPFPEEVEENAGTESPIP